MPEARRRFLISFKRGDPDCTLLGVPAAARIASRQMARPESNQADGKETQ
jgi:hypothetical protein